MGLVLESGEIVELKNRSPTPTLTFMVPLDEVEKYKGKAVAMWHTHPRNNPNLSTADFAVFQQLPWLTQYIVTETKVRCFVVRNKRVMLHEANCV